MKKFDSVQHPSPKADTASLGDQITLLAGQINAAFANGAISYLMVRAMTRRAVPIQKELQNQLQFVLPSGCVKISAEIFPEKEASADSFAELVAQTRADALTVAEHFLATYSDSEPHQGLKGGERCQTGLHVDIDTLVCGGGG